MSSFLLSAQWALSPLPETATASKTGITLPQAPSQRTICSGGAGHQHFASCPQLPVGEAGFWEIKPRFGDSLILPIPYLLTEIPHKTECYWEFGILINLALESCETRMPRQANWGEPNLLSLIHWALST